MQRSKTRREEPEKPLTTMSKRKTGSVASRQIAGIPRRSDRKVPAYLDTIICGVISPKRRSRDNPSPLFGSWRVVDETTGEMWRAHYGKQATEAIMAGGTDVVLSISAENVVRMPSAHSSPPHEGVGDL